MLACTHLNIFIFFIGDISCCSRMLALQPGIIGLHSIHLDYQLESGCCWGNWGNFENVSFFFHWHHDCHERRRRVTLKLSPSCFLIPLSLFVRSLPLLWFCKWDVWEAGSSVKPLCWHQQKKKGGWKKQRPKDKAALKSNRASAAAAGATARVQAQLCNKEEGGWERGWGGGCRGCWRCAPSDVPLCSVVPLGFSYSPPLHTSAHRNMTWYIEIWNVT